MIDVIVLMLWAKQEWKWDKGTDGWMKRATGQKKNVDCSVVAWQDPQMSTVGPSWSLWVLSVYVAMNVSLTRAF